MRILAKPAFSNRAKNPYNWLLYTKLAKLGVDVIDFSIYHLLKEKWDILHVHWPDNAFRTPKYFLAVYQAVNFLMAVTLAKKKGTNIVWTVHNIEAHEKYHPKLHNFFMNFFTKRVDGLIALNSSTKELLTSKFPVFDKVPTVTVPHGHYRDVYPNDVSKNDARKKLNINSPGAKVVLFFGRLRSYKNIVNFVRTFHSINDPKAVLLIAGRPASPELEKEIIQICSIDRKRIQLNLDFIPESDMQFYFKAADLVVLPYLNVLNSGAALLSLSYSVPILVPKQGSFKDLQLILGKEWVRTYDGSLSPEELIYHLDCVTKSEHRYLSMNYFNWDDIAKSTFEFYRDLTSM